MENTDSIEKTLLGFFLIDNSLFVEGIDELFPLEAHKKIYREMEKFHKEGRFFDEVILGDCFYGKYPDVSYVSSLTVGIPLNSRFSMSEKRNEYIKILKENFIKQKVKETDDFGEMKRLVSSFNVDDRDKKIIGVEESLKQYIDFIKEDTGGIELGYRDLDSAIGGLRYGELLLFMARTTVGKTFWALNVVKNISHSKKDSIGFFSLEMSSISLIERLLQIFFSQSRKDLVKKIKEGNLEDSELKLYLDYFFGLKIFHGVYSVEEIGELTEKEGCQIVIVDFLGLIKEESGSSLYEKTSNIIRKLKQMAKERNIILIVLVQLSREAKDGSIPVTLNMARESGQIEEIADFIIGAWRPELCQEEAQNGKKNKCKELKEKYKNQIFLELLKNKRGEGKLIKCHFDEKSRRIYELDEEGGIH